MKITIYKYILNEIWPTFLACLFVSVFIVVATKMLSKLKIYVGTDHEHQAQQPQAIELGIKK